LRLENNGTAVATTGHGALTAMIITGLDQTLILSLMNLAVADYIQVFATSN
jgi:hypothetical protein